MIFIGIRLFQKPKPNMIRHINSKDASFGKITVSSINNDKIRRSHYRSQSIIATDNKAKIIWRTAKMFGNDRERNAPVLWWNIGVGRMINNRNIYNALVVNSLGCKGYIFSERSRHQGLMWNIKHLS